MKLAELLAMLEKFKVEAQVINDNPEATAEDITAKLNEIKAINAKIAMAEQLEADAKLDIENKIKVGKAKKVDGQDPENKDDVDVRETQAYTDGFYNFVRGTELTAEQKQVMNVIGTSGVPVPKSFQNKLIIALDAMNIMRQLSTVITTSSDLDIPYVVTKGSAAWTDENISFNDSDDTFGVISLSAYKLTRIVKVSEEILQDNTIDLEGYLVQSFARAIGMPEESAFINGDGTKKPTGVFVGASAGKTAASATVIIADELIDLFYSLARVYRNKASWIMNDNTLKAIRKLKDGQNNYIWAAGITANEPETILGRPVYSSAFDPDIATGKRVIAFGDMSYYTIADRSARTFQRLNELYSANGQVGFRGYERTDGKLTLAEAVKVLTMA